MITLISYARGSKRSKITKLPIIRGVFGFIDSMAMGYKCLMRSAELSGLEEAIVVSLGTGTAIVHARAGQDSDYLGGTGVGGGVVVEGRLMEGNKSAGAELGHKVIVAGGEQCTCGRKGCLEAYASATALIRDTRRAMEAHKDSKMWETYDMESVSGKTAFDYKDSDVYAKEVVDNYLSHLASGIIDFANIFRPEAILLGGGVCAQGDNLLKPLQKMLDKEIFGGDLGPKVPILIAELGNSAGVLGAVALLLD